MDMTAKLNQKEIFVYLVSVRGDYVIASYTQDDQGKFKINIEDLTDVSVELQAEINKKGEGFY